MTTQVAIVDAEGKQAGSVELPASIFDVQTNVPLIHQVVVAQLAAARQGTHAVKGRGEVSGSGAKPFKQKGTGRARQGSVRMPQHRGGGIVHGPVPRDYAQRTPKKMIAAALRGALSDRARGGRLHLVESFAGETPKTRAVVEMLGALGVAKNVLVVLDRSEEIAFLSVRNLPEVHVLAWDQLNAYDVLVSDDVVFSKTAYEAFVAAKSGAPAVVSDEAPAGEEAVEVETAEEAPAAAAADFGPDSHAALADGSAPEGFEIKGNANSMKFHRPDGRWYEQTEAEVWFRTAEAAEAAGFTEAGKASKADKADKDN
ncbi:50S ribosomal protein L4, sunset domain variant [Agrococcus carbonis]|uniref:Large ribosomal subunit protein uL4 n=1 Tax=Agrococcus carbonis TaxID=684552 RepID=A0A1H1QNI0_9MICO|nr:50S ribosomal protein L4 [Agrococcus carbonis]SDS25032.1 LSU ribosomal protein L4P [Agrococcus carbonis]